MHERVAEDMARVARKLFDADVGLAVTGIANTPGPDSRGRQSGLVTGTSWVGFATNDGVGSLSGSYPSSRLRIRSRAVTHALLGLVRFLND